MADAKRTSPENQLPRDVADDGTRSRPAEAERPIDSQDPDSMPRAEDDPQVFENSPEFHDRPGGTNPADHGARTRGARTRG